jgi:2,3-bisphosphoglycerate-dependent phosphoglycerate mutase
MVRHGETAWNAEGRVQGQLDIPLSPAGEAQARAVAEALAGERFDALYSSDLVRVQQTAAPCVARLGLDVRLDRRLRERHYGSFQGHTYADAKVMFPADYARFRAKEPEFDFGTGESLLAFHSRCMAVLKDIHERHRGGSVLVFTHGGVLEMAYRHATGRGLSSVRDFEIPNAGLNYVEIGPERWTVLAWAGIGHLSVSLDDLPG